MGMASVTNSVTAVVGGHLAPASQASISLFDFGTTNAAPIFQSDETTPVAQPVLTDAKGNFAFFVAAGKYTLQIVRADVIEMIDVTFADPDGGGGGGHTIEDEGTPLTDRSALNFVGAGVTVTDDAGNDATVVTIPGNGAAPLFANFTPSITASWASVMTIGAAQVKDLDDEIKVVIRAKFTGAPTGFLNIDLPLSKSLSPVLFDLTESAASIIGSGAIRDDSAVVTYRMHVTHLDSSSTSVRVRIDDANALNDGIASTNLSATDPFTIASGDHFWLEFTVPVV